MGVRGVAVAGDLRGNEREFCAAEMLRESLGLAARAAYMVEDVIMKMVIWLSRSKIYVDGESKGAWSNTLVNKVGFPGRRRRIDDTIIIF